ncbi:MAG: hypothetical protein RIF44_03335 [Nitratireductor sp.]
MRQVLKPVWRARRAIVFYLLLLAIGWTLGEVMRQLVIPEPRPLNEPTIHRIVTVSLIAFVVAAAIPFVPGAEIGLVLLLLFGSKAAPVVYVALVCALLLAYLAARCVSPTSLVPGLEWLGLRRTAALARAVGSAQPEDRVRALANHLPARVSRIGLKNRYVLLALLINLPGNSLLGGGGGLAFAAGLSRIYGFWPFTMTIVLAVAPIPLVFWLL